MRKKRLIFAIVVIIILLALSIGLWLFFSRSNKNKNELVLYGNVDVRQVDIGFRVPGQVTELYFEEGDLVKQGDLLAVLDKTPYDNQVRESIALLSAAKASFENAQILLKRRRELVNEGGVSQEDVDNALATEREARASLEQAESALAIALDNLGYTEAFAPTVGTILTRIREPGTVVNASDPVYTISVASPVWIRAYVDESHLGQIYYGMTAKISTDTPQGKVYTGKIGFISPVAEFTPKTVETTQLRTDLVYRLRIYVDNPDHYLKQGMPITVKLKTGKKSGRSSHQH